MVFLHFFTYLLSLLQRLDEVDPAAADGRGLSDGNFTFVFDSLHVCIYTYIGIFAFFIYFLQRLDEVEPAAAVGRGLSDGGEMQQRTAIGRCPPFTILIF